MTEKTPESSHPYTRRATLVAFLIVAAVIASGIGAWWFIGDDSQDVSRGPLTTLVRDPPPSLTFVISEEPHLGSPNETVTVIVVWGYVAITFTNLSESGYIWTYRPTTESLVGEEGQSKVVQLSPEGVASSSYGVNCSITDQTGNGILNEGDSFTLILDGFALELASEYVVSIIYETTGSAMGECELTG